MRVEDLTLFLKVVEFGSFSAVAQLLDLPRANISRRINELEKELGTRLFIRTTRQLSLTSQGAQYYSQVSGIIQDLEQANLALTEQTQSLTGKVKIGVLLGSEESLNIAIAEFMDKHPTVCIESRFTNNSMTDMFQYGLDFAMHIGKLHDSSFIGRHLGTFSRMVVASPDYLARHGRPSSPEQLLGQRILAFRWPDASLESHWSIGGRDWPIQPALISNHYGQMIQAAVNGNGIGYLPYVMAYPFLKDGRLEILFSGLETESEDVWLLYPSREGMTATARALMEHIIATLPDFLPENY